jgi:alpha-tubulin suppressor-like RCC1 family protein
LIVRGEAVAATATTLAALLAGCAGPGDFRCATYAQCGPNAFCEVDGRCSVADPSCAPAGRRYVRASGDRSSACVPASCAANPVVAVSAGGSHACALRADGLVACWGRNDDGQLGDGTRTPRSIPVRVSGLGKAVAIAAGARHTCAALATGTVVCWGADDAGQLGDGGGADRLTNVEVAGIANAAAVVAADGFSCALLADATVACWGDDTSGAIGDGTAAPVRRTPTAVAGLASVAALSAHWQHACALGGDGSVRCWGENSSGQLGDGTLTARATPTLVQGVANARAIAAGLSHSCAATQTGLLCWGSNTVGQLGIAAAASMTPVSAPAAVALVPDPVAVDAGAQHTCAVRASGQILCWGQNSAGQLGEGSMSSLAEPVPVTGLGDGVRVATGATYSCALDAEGSVLCWGDDHYGQLGAGTGVFEPRPVAVGGVAPTHLTAAGGAHGCAATMANPSTSETLVCWGGDQAGQLGDNGDVDRARAAKIEVPLDPSAIAAGALHTCAIDPATGLWCWGRGSSGQLGLGPARMIDTPLPTAVTLPGGYARPTAAAAGDAHTCVIAPASAGATGGDVLCFGDNARGELGDGTTAGRSVAAPVVAFDGPSGAERALRLAAGGAHTCAIADSGGLWCWGSGDRGEIGVGGTSDQPTPAPVPVGMAPVTAVALGGAHTCAIDSIGAVYCWGANDRGQLGIGSAGADVTSPARVSGPAAVAIAAGGDHTCASYASGQVACWGANDTGDLGDGTTMDRAGPAVVANVSGTVTAGGAHSCASNGGALACWGADTSGQLGDGIDLTISAPEVARLACDEL